MSSESNIRREIVRIGQKIEAKGFIAATDGNLSCRLDERRILITPSGFAKGELTPEDLLIVDLDGKRLSGRGIPSSETPMHTQVYRQRPDVQAVIHAHPPVCTALSLAKVSLAACVIPEVVITMGAIPTAPYATPATEEGALVIKDYIQETDVIILDRHGCLTVGDSLRAAYFKLEKLEHSAYVTWMAKQMGEVQPLPPAEIERLIELRKKLGIKSRTNPCEGCTSCPEGKNAPATDRLADIIMKEIVAEIKTANG